VEFTAHVWIDDAEQACLRGSQLHEAIWWALKDADIKIAIQQLDVHLERDFRKSRRRSS